MKTTPNGFAALLQASLGTRWQHLHPDIRARFTPAPGVTRQRFTGSMSEIDRSFIGWLIAHAIAFVRVLPAARARAVPFEFNLAPAPGAGWFKERLYHFAPHNGGRFEFRSIMRIARNGDLIEQFPYGLGMKIKLEVEGDNGDSLMFRDDGYFLRVGPWRLPLPRWLGVGRFTLAHRNIDRERFTVDICIDHPFFGRLYYQAGHFRQAPVAFTPSTSLTAPDAAHKAAPGTAY